MAAAFVTFVYILHHVSKIVMVGPWDQVQLCKKGLNWFPMGCTLVGKVFGYLPMC